MDPLLDSVVSVARPQAISSTAMPSPLPTADAQPNPSPPSLLPAPPLPPPAPPASTSASTSNLVTRPWPKNHQGPLRLFFDPFSAKISSLRTEIQNNLSSSGRSLPTTMLATEATHLILDPHCPQSSWVRQAARPDQHVVRFEWVEDSLLHGFSVPEGGYQMDSRGFGGSAATSSSGNGKSMEVEEGRDEVEEEGREMEEERSDSGPDYSSSEEEGGGGDQRDWSAFNVAPRRRIPKTNRICHNCLTKSSNDWRLLKERGNALTCGRCRTVYYSARKRHPGTEDAALAARKKLVEGDEPVGASSGDEVVDSEDGERVSASRTPLVSATRHRRRRPAWSESERKELAQLIADSPGAMKLEIHKSFSSQHPERTVSATKNQHDLNRPWYEAEVRRLRRKGKKEHRVGAGSISESDSDSNLDARPSPLPSSSIRNGPGPVTSSSLPPVAQGSSRNTTIEQPQLGPVASSSSHLHPPANVFSLSLSSANPLTHLQEPLPRPSTSSHPSGTQVKPRPNRSFSEPDAFRMVGVAPSSLPPNTHFCFFCGTTRTSGWYTVHDLVGWKEVNGKKILSRAASRPGSCNSCYSIHLRRTKEVGIPKEIWERGEMKRLLWATEQLLIRGMRLRGEVVEGKR